MIDRDKKESVILAGLEFRVFRHNEPSLPYYLPIAC